MSNFYERLGPSFLAVVAKERGLKVEEKEDLSKRLEQEDDKNPSWLVELEEANYFSPSSPGLAFSFLAFKGILLEEPSLLLYSYKEVLASAIRACQIIQGEERPKYEKEHAIVLFFLTSRVLGRTFLCYTIKELTNIANDGFKYDKKGHALRSERFFKYSRFSKYMEIGNVYQKVYGNRMLLYSDSSSSCEWPELYENEDKKEASLYALEASKLGMLIPGSERNPESYFRENIHHYLKGQGDLHFFKEVNGFFPYSSRQDIIYRHREISNKIPYFTIPLEHKNVSNAETTLRSKTKELKPESVLAFGARWYELDELELAFSSVTAGFIRPEDPKSFFSLREINRLEQLLLCYYSPKYKDLLRLISTGKGVLALLSEAESEFKAKAPAKLKDLLFSLFEAGMYMRRWKGPGHKYPSEAKDTESKDKGEKEVDEAASLALERVSGLIAKEKLEPFFQGLKLKGFGGTLLEVKSFKDLYTQVREGTFCIRVASLYFINTACYYLLNVYGVKVENYTYDAELIM